MVSQKRPTNNPKNPYTIETDYRAISQKRLTAQNNTTTFLNYEITLDMAFELNQDFTVAKISEGKVTKHEYIISLGMAKEISMIQNKGEC